MSNKILTIEEVVEIEARARTQGNPVLIVHARNDIPALCATVRQLLSENERLKEELQCACEFCDEPVYDQQGNALTFLVCGRCWNQRQEQLK